MWDIIVNSTDVAPNSLQRNVFIWREGDPCQQPAQLNASNLEPCTFLKDFDYFAVCTLYEYLIRLWIFGALCVFVRQPFYISSLSISQKIYAVIEL